MNAEFTVHILNSQGIAKANALAEAFDACLNLILKINPSASREMSLVRTKMEEASFFAKKAMANDPQNWKETASAAG